MVSITVKELMESGAHFGHLTRKWNPKMKRYIFGARNGIHIIDLGHSLKCFKSASDAAVKVSSLGGNILFVGTKRQAQAAIEEAAKMTQMPFVTKRWLGGTLTNFSTIQGSIQRLKEIKRIEASPDFEKLSKKEKIVLSKEKIRLDELFAGISEMKKIPQMVFVVDAKKEANCIKEANRIGIPIIAILDTNCDPDEITFPLPGNDDAIKSIQLFTNKIAESVLEGKAIFDATEQARKEEEEEEAAKASVKGAKSLLHHDTLDEVEMHIRKRAKEKTIRRSEA